MKKISMVEVGLSDPLEQGEALCLLHGVSFEKLDMTCIGDYL